MLVSILFNYTSQKRKKGVIYSTPCEITSSVCRDTRSTCTLPPVESARANAALIISLLMEFPLFIRTLTKPGDGIMMFFSAIAAFNNDLIAVKYFSAISSVVFSVIFCFTFLTIYCMRSEYIMVTNCIPAGRGRAFTCTARVPGNRRPRWPGIATHPGRRLTGNARNGPGTQGVTGRKWWETRGTGSESGQPRPPFGRKRMEQPWNPGCNKAQMVP